MMYLSFFLSTLAIQSFLLTKNVYLKQVNKFCWVFVFCLKELSTGCCPFRTFNYFFFSSFSFFFFVAFVFVGVPNRK